MNDNNLNGKYHATKNLNTALEKPEFTVNDAYDVNIEDVNNNNVAKDVGTNLNRGVYDINIANNQVNVNNKIDDSSFVNEGINKNFSEVSNSMSDLNIGSNDNKVTYTPTSTTTKKKVSFTITPELKLMVLIVVFLLIFIFFMPVIYDFFSDIKSSIFNR